MDPKDSVIMRLYCTQLICSSEQNDQTSLLCTVCFIFLAPILTHKAPNTTIAEFANTVDPDETAHDEPSHLDLQSLPSSL